MSLMQRRINLRAGHFSESYNVKRVTKVKTFDATALNVAANCVIPNGVRDLTFAAPVHERLRNCVRDCEVPRRLRDSG